MKENYKEPADLIVIDSIRTMPICDINEDCDECPACDTCDMYMDMEKKYFPKTPQGSEKIEDVAAFLGLKLQHYLKLCYFYGAEDYEDKLCFDIFRSIAQKLSCHLIESF
jgi:hypothetical protein